MAGPAKIWTMFFRSKVAQRIVILFVSCALLPVMILAVVSFYEVSSQLREDSARQLMRASKNQAMAIYERIELLDSDLQLLAAQVSDRRTPAISKVLQDRFDSVTVFGPDGSVRALWGRPATAPQLSPVEHEHLRSGEPLVQVASCSNGSDPCVHLIRTTEQGFTIVGMPKGDYLWAAKNVPAG